MRQLHLSSGEGVIVWLLAVIIAVIVATVGAEAGSKYNVVASLNNFSRVPVDEGSRAPPA